MVYELVIEVVYNPRFTCSHDCINENKIVPKNMPGELS